MPTNDFKPFATAGGANVSTQAEYLALAALSTGWQSGKASAKEINKAVRQATFIAAALAQFVSDKGAVDVLDDGNLAGFGTKLIGALNKTSQPLDATLTALAALVGAANKLPYFNGADTAALTDLTQVGRDIIGKSDIAAVLTYLGLDDTIDHAAISLSRDKNLSDLNDVPTSRVSLGLKGAALLDVGSIAEVLAGTVGKLVSIPALTAFFDLSATALNGSIRIPARPGGILIAWGSVPAGSGGTFTAAFTSAPFVVASPSSSVSGNISADTFYVNATSATGFTTIDQTLPRKYIAIGK